MATTRDFPISASKVIPREAGGVALADEGLQPQVRRMMQSAEEQSQEVFADAERQGLAKGEEAGRREFLQATAEAVRSVREEFFALEPLLGPLVLQAVEKILGKLPAGDVTKSVLMEALAETGAGLAVTLRVAPDDIEDMRRSWSEIVADIPAMQTALTGIEADAGLHKGEMILETLKGRTHVGVAYQLARLRFGVLGTSA